MFRACKSCGGVCRLIIEHLGQILDDILLLVWGTLRKVSVVAVCLRRIWQLWVLKKLLLLLLLLLGNRILSIEELVEILVGIDQIIKRLIGTRWRHSIIATL